MNCVKDEADTQILFEKQSDSSSHDECSSGQSSAGRRAALKKGPWTTAEDTILISYVNKHGEGNWNTVQKHSGLSRCGKSCRLRWVNHLRPNLKKGAFSPAEEQAIIQLHNRMGNRWARMAAFIPGRTDNEIKNFWNTLIKRRQRAGLPPHPNVVCARTSPENQQFENAIEFSRDDKLNSTVLQGAMHDIPQFHFDPSRANTGPLCYGPSSVDLPVSGMLSPSLGSHADSVSGMLSQGIESHTSSFLNPGVDCVRWKWVSESTFRGYHNNVSAMVLKSERLLGIDSEIAYWNCGSGYPHEPDPCYKNPVSSGSIPGSHALLNGNFSASSHPLGTVKVELPSLQYPGSDYSNSFTSPRAAPYAAINTYIQSPGNVQVQPGCASPRSNGLLEALVHESQAISCGKKQSYENTFSPPFSPPFSPSDMIESSNIEWEDTSEPCSPFSQSAVSILNECNTPMSRDSSGLQMTRWGVEQVSTPGVQAIGDLQRPGFLRPDALLGSDCPFASFQNSVDDAIAALRGEDFWQQHASLNSYGWNSMPRVRQI